MLIGCGIGVEPRYMGVGPIPAIRSVLGRYGLSKEEIDVYEVRSGFPCPLLQG